MLQKVERRRFAFSDRLFISRPVWTCFSTRDMIIQGREMGQGPARVHPLPESHFQQQSWLEETV
jgi:hypothetical protein